MKKTKKRILILVVVVIIAIQFWPVDRTNPPVISDIQAPEPVKQVLHMACYDCHSNETKWPWYSYIAPVSWMIADDVHHARSHFNFSEWNSMPASDRPYVIERMGKAVESGGMPLWTYRLMHSAARLSEEQKNLLKDWTDTAKP